ncbi:hypothetical protein [Candidatus Wolbachia massiliensis]|uniref:Uncharacterized protein n=1 Tax=Candidatus Wolbachia massiliensis TaxID=1845000 RepID=A0A7L7YQY8_9RICK|nr:hypothetical protein [Candidatus Wolbachia massiliensis]QOD38067.1 hypothetical protein ID128_04560 [Candidatus Wolbachia massiliensis]
MRKQVNIDQEQIKSVLENIEIGHYLEFILTYGTYSRKNDNDKILAHSILIYKAENSKYIFFDSNKGAVGFCPDTGIASLTPKEICKTLELAVNSSLYYQYIENFPVFSDGCFTWVIFRNATLMLKKAEQFYKTKTNPNSKIIEISVDKNTNNLVFTPVLP